MKVFTVSELTFAIKSVLEPNFRSLSVQGEISNFKAQSSGHLYFTLKDANAQLSAVLFKGNAASLPRMPKEGDQVIVQGEISLYAPRGSYQMIVRSVQFLGVGELLLKFHQLKEKLQERGWFDLKHKKPLPKLPKRIGVVTSPTGAVIQDILHVLTRRFSGFHVLLYPVKVQGDGAAQEIATAIQDFNQHSLADVLIVGRGGGSIEDLWAFNEEIVAQAIFASQIPVISAVGHETDFTIADLVADIRAPTPSAAAEIAMAEKENLLKFLLHTQQAIRQRVFEQVSQNKQKLTALCKYPPLSSPYHVLSQSIQQLDAMRNAFELLKPSNQVMRWKERLHPLPDRVVLSMRRCIAEKKGKFARLAEHLQSLDPRNLLQKGYAILFQNSATILSARDLCIEQPFTAVLHDGRIVATAHNIEETDGRKSLL